MKYFPLIFLFCVASASLLEIYPNSDEEDFLLKAEERTPSANEKVKTEIGKKLRDLLDRVLKRIKESVEDGKHVGEDVLDKVKGVVQKLKDYGAHVSDDAKKLLEELGSKYHKWAKELLDIIHGKSSVYYSEPEVKTELAKELREKFEHIVRRIKKLVEEGKHVSEELWDEAKDLARKMKKYDLRVSDEASDMMNYMKERVTRWIDELLEIIHGDNSTVYYSEPEVKTELAKELREKFEQAVRHIKKLVEEGKHVSAKMWKEVKDLAKKLKEYGLNVTDEMFDMFEFFKERGHRWVEELIDIFRGKKEAL